MTQQGESVYFFVKAFDKHVIDQVQTSTVVLLQVDFEPVELILFVGIEAVVDVVGAGVLVEVIADVERLIVHAAVFEVDEGYLA